MGLFLILKSAAKSGKVGIAKAMRSHPYFKDIPPRFLIHILETGADKGHINILEALSSHPKIADRQNAHPELQKTLLKIAKTLHPNLDASFKMPLSRQIALGRKKGRRK